MATAFALPVQRCVIAVCAHRACSVMSVMCDGCCCQSCVTTATAALASHPGSDEDPAWVRQSYIYNCYGCRRRLKRDYDRSITTARSLAVTAPEYNLGRWLYLFHAEFMQSIECEFSRETYRPSSDWPVINHCGRMPDTNDNTVKSFKQRKSFGENTNCLV